MQTRKAANVFPDPVGAAMSVCRPCAIAGHPAFWGVGGLSELPAEPFFPTMG